MTTSFASNENLWSTGQKVLVLLAFVVIAAMGLHTIAHGNFWMHLANGRWFADHGLPREEVMSFASQPGQRWVNPSWLYDRILYALWNTVGSKGIILLHVGLVIGTYLALLPIARRWANGLAVAGALLWAAWMMVPQYSVGPHLLAIFWAALFVLLLSGRRSYSRLALVVLLQILWANTDASFALGVLLCAVYTFEEVAVAVNSQAPSKWRAPLTLVILTVICALATLLNPYHFRVWQAFSLPILRTSGVIREWISPFAPLFPGSALPRVGVAIGLIIGAGGMLTERRKLPVALTTLAVFMAIIGVTAIYYVHMVAVLALPFIALSLQATGPTLGRFFERVVAQWDIWSARLVGGVIVIISVLTLAGVFTNGLFSYMGSAAVFGLGVNHDLFPSQIGPVLQKASFPARAFNLPSDGGYLLWRYPERKVFMDTKPRVYPTELFELGNRVVAGDIEAWKTIEERWKVDAAILNCAAPAGAAIARTLLLTGQWRLAHFDGATAVLARHGEAWAELVPTEEEQKAGLRLLEAEKQAFVRSLGGYRRFGNPVRLIGAGNFFLALGRWEQAEAVYDILTRGCPEMAGAWLNLGISRIHLKKFKEAETALLEATKLAPQNVNAWLQLSEVYAQLKDDRAEKAALNKAVKLNPAATRAFVQARGRKLD